MMAMTQLIRPGSNFEISSVSEPVDDASKRKIPVRSRVSVEALRLVELSDRTSAVMKSWAAESVLQTDPILGIFKMFGLLNDFPIRTALSIVPYDDLAHSVTEHAQAWGSDLIILPWLPPHPVAPLHYAVHPQSANTPTPSATRSNNPFDALWKSQHDGPGGSSAHPSEMTNASAIHSQFVRGVFMPATTDVALFVDQTGVLMPNAVASDMQHLFLPFFGGPDDRLALEFVAQCCENPRITATIVKIIKVETDVEKDDQPTIEHATIASVSTLSLL
jgi:hypothetical protein